MRGGHNLARPLKPSSTTHFLLDFPEEWFLEDYAPVRRAPFLRVWYKSSDYLEKRWLSNQEFEYMLKRIKKKENLGWHPSADEIDAMQYHLVKNPETKLLADRIFFELKPPTWRSLFTPPRLKKFTARDAFWANHCHDRHKWPLFNNMLLRHDKILGNTP
ncbi:hypothetical protein TRICI_001342 [Trichomonascus ciferrii]|uniref:Uncharacterized protein n=1 Tax=Trichomonascus ciferrii TaxID=44093 RepID=A0A642V9V3_9ASCO|nr:hypothetical protein TRICI_001342 [Trichomonascus ciferrii]